MFTESIDRVRIAATDWIRRNRFRLPWQPAKKSLLCCTAFDCPRSCEVARAGIERWSNGRIKQWIGLFPGSTLCLRMRSKKSWKPGVLRRNTADSGAAKQRYGNALASD